MPSQEPTAPPLLQDSSYSPGRRVHCSSLNYELQDNTDHQMEFEKGELKNIVCQTCGDIGFHEALVYCLKCKSSAEHRYCFSKLLKNLCEDITWFCDQCNLKVSTSQVEGTPCQLSARKPERKSKKRRARSTSDVFVGNKTIKCQSKLQPNADLVANDTILGQQPTVCNTEGHDPSYSQKEVQEEIDGSVGPNGRAADGRSFTEIGAVMAKSDSIEAQFVLNLVMPEMACYEEALPVSAVGCASNSLDWIQSGLESHPSDILSSGEPNSNILHVEEKLNCVQGVSNEDVKGNISSSAKISSLQPDVSKCEVSLEILSTAKGTSAYNSIPTDVHVNEEGGFGYGDTIQGKATHIKENESSISTLDVYLLPESCSLHRNNADSDAAMIDIDDDAYPGTSNAVGIAENRSEPRLVLEDNRYCDDSTPCLLTCADDIDVNGDSSLQFEHPLATSIGKDSTDDFTVSAAENIASDDISSYEKTYVSGKHLNSGTWKENSSIQASLVDLVLTDDLQCSAFPIPEPIWSGSFDICVGFHGLATGHLSRKACTKVIDAARSLPPILFLEEKSRLELWPNSFKRSPPTGENIAMFFFCGSNHQAYVDTLNDVTTRDLGLRSTLADSELLIFSSIHLPAPYQEFHGKTYLWGVFRARKDLSTMPSSKTCSMSEVEKLESVNSKGLNDREFLKGVSDLHDNMMAATVSKTDDEDYSTQIKLDLHEQRNDSISYSVDHGNGKNVESFEATASTDSIPCVAADADFLTQAREMCNDMNSAGLWRLIRGSKKLTMKSVGPQMSQILMNCVDPPCFVLDTISRFIVFDLKFNAGNHCEAGCLMLLASLRSAMESSDLVSSKAFLSPGTKTWARAVADSWKEIVLRKRFQKSKGPLPYTETFLMLVVTFEVIDEAERPLYEVLVKDVTNKKESGRMRQLIASLFVDKIRQFTVDHEYHVDSLRTNVQQLEQQVDEHMDEESSIIQQDDDPNSQMNIDSCQQQNDSIVHSVDCDNKNVEPFEATAPTGSVPCAAARADFLTQARFLCNEMNSERFWRLIKKAKKFTMKTIRPQMPRLLMNCVDPPCFVLDTISKLVNFNLKFYVAARHERGCLMLLTSLRSAMESSKMAFSRAFLTPGTKERARALADSWKENILRLLSQKTAARVPYVQTFLMLVITFEVIDEDERPLYEVLVRAVSTREGIPKLAKSLGLGHGFLRGVIWHLIQKHRQFAALEFICEVGLLEEFPLITLFESYLTNKKAAGKSMQLITSLFVNKIRQLTVDSEYEENSLRAHVQQLEKQVDRHMDEKSGVIQQDNPDAKSMPDGGKIVKNDIQHVAASVQDQALLTADECLAQLIDCPLPPVSSQFAAHKQIDHCPVTAASGSNAMKQSSLVVNAKTYCTAMNFEGLWNLITSSKTAVSRLQNQLPQLLTNCVDPFLFVLNAISSVMIPDLKACSPESHERQCLLLLNSLPSSTGSSKLPFVVPSTKERARAIADSWKEKVLGKWTDEKTLLPFSHTFLMLVSTFGILDEAEKPLYGDLVTTLATRKAIPKLSLSLHLGLDFFRHLIRQLQKRGLPLSALNFIYEVGLLEEFPPVPLLESYLNELKNYDKSKQVLSLRTVINKVSRFKIKYPVDSLKTRIKELEQQVEPMNDTKNSCQHQDSDMDVETGSECGASAKDDVEDASGSLKVHDRDLVDEFQDKSTACLPPLNSTIQIAAHEETNQFPLAAPLVSGAELKKEDLAMPLVSGAELKKEDLAMPLVSGAELKKEDLATPLVSGAELKKEDLATPLVSGAELKKEDLATPLVSGAELKKQDLATNLNQNKKGFSNPPVQKGSNKSKKRKQIPTQLTAQENTGNRADKCEKIPVKNNMKSAGMWNAWHSNYSESSGRGRGETNFARSHSPKPVWPSVDNRGTYIHPSARNPTYYPSVHTHNSYERNTAASPYYEPKNAPTYYPSIHTYSAYGSQTQPLPKAPRLTADAYGGYPDRHNNYMPYTWYRSGQPMYPPPPYIHPR